MGLLFPTLIILPAPTGRHPVSSQDTSSWLFVGRLSLGGDHALLIGEVRYKILWRHAETADTALGADRAAASTVDAHWMRRITRMWEWLSVLLYTINGIELGVQEWRDSLFLRYGIDPLELLYHCNGCGAAFSIYHALD